MARPVNNELARLCREGRSLAAIRSKVRKRLAVEHITTVFLDIVGSSDDLTDEDIRSLGFPADIAASFSNPTDSHTFNYAPALPGFQLLAESAAHPLKHVRLQFPGTYDGAAIGLKVLRNMLGVLDADTRVSVAVKPGANGKELGEVIRYWGYDPDRVDLFEQETESLFARDNGVSGRVDGGGAAMLLPRVGGERAMSGDPLCPKLLNEHFSMPVVRSKLFWDGGNILFDDVHCLIGANTIALNIQRLGLSESEVVTAFQSEFGVDVSVAGDVCEALETLRRGVGTPYAKVGGQADFHIDLDICLLGEIEKGRPPVAALADADMGRRSIADILNRRSLFKDHFLPPPEINDIFVSSLKKTVARRKQRLASYESLLSGLGYDVIKIPDVRIYPEDNILGRVNFTFNYVNVIPALAVNGKTSLFLFGYGVDGLDRAAFEAYSAAGVDPVFLGNDPVTSNETFKYQGGPHCLYAKMA
jgi:hypothetical protein